jgi:hypothetical protein
VEIGRSGLARKEKNPRKWGKSGVITYSQKEMKDMEEVQQLTLVQVKTLAVTIED